MPHGPERTSFYVTDAVDALYLGDGSALPSAQAWLKKRKSPAPAGASA